MSFDKEMVRVYNYNRFGVSLPTKEGGMFLRPCADINYPVMETFTFNELEYINTHTSFIRTGMVEFADDEREEIYAALRFRGWKESCFFEREIDDLLINADFKLMERVLEIKDMPTIDRIYGHMRRLVDSNSADISSRVQKVIEGRRNELYKGVYTSQIRLVPKTQEEPKADTAPAQDEIAKMVAQQVAEALKAQKEVESAKPAAKPKTTAKKTPAKKPAVKTTTKTAQSKVQKENTSVPENS